MAADGLCFLKEIKGNRLGVSKRHINYEVTEGVSEKCEEYNERKVKYWEREIGSESQQCT